MSATLRAAARSAQAVVHMLSFGLVLLATVAMTLWCLGAAIGLLPWLEFTVQAGGAVYDKAGQITQIALTLLCLMLAGFLPGQARIMALETSHRQFRLGMEDVAQAFHLAHAADRGGVFRLKSEFDSMRERLAYMRRHPDLADLEPEILDLAAQMSFLSRALAETYSDAAVGRAKLFLRQRQQELDSFRDRLTKAKAISAELQHWLQQIETEEAEAAAQLAQLRAQMAVLLSDVPGLETRARAKVPMESVPLDSVPHKALNPAAE